MSDATGHGAVAAGESWASHVRRLWALALPLIGARMAEFVIPIADAAMVGRHDTAALAALGIGWQPWIFLDVTGLGLLVAVSILTAQAHGAGDVRRKTLVLQQGLRQAVLIGLVLTLLCQFGAPFLHAIGLDPALAESGGAVLRAYGWGAPAAMLYLATSFFMAGTGRPLPDMLIMGVAVPVKLGLNWLLIGGHGGLPAFGAAGAALATSAMIWLAAIVFVLYVRAIHKEAWCDLQSGRAERRAVSARLLRVGVPVALSLALETGAYLALALIAGYLGAATIGAYRVAMSVALAPFMIGMALAGATSVRVGHAIGRASLIDMRHAAVSGFALVSVAMILFAVPIGVTSTSLATLFASERELVPSIAASLQVTAIYLLFEGLQVVLKLVLRSMGDVWAPFWISVGSYWFVGIAAAAFLGLAQGLGAPGITAGLGIAMLVSALGNALRYRRVARQQIARL